MASTDQNTKLVLEGLERSGSFVIDRSDQGHDIPLCLKFTKSAKADAPIAIVMPGYRGDAINGDNGLKLAATFIDNGFSVLQINFAGFDTYGCEAAPESADTGTIPSNIDDLQTVLTAIGGQTPVILVANSASINVAVPAAAEFKNVSHIFAVSPFPNIVPFSQDVLSGYNLIPEEGGYVIPFKHGLPFDRSVKITSKFLDSGQPSDLLGYEAYSLLPHDLKVICVRSKNDSVVPRTTFGNNLADDWMQVVSIKLGKIPDDLIVDGDSHEISDTMLRVISERVFELAIEMKLRKPTPYPPTSTLQI